VGKSARQVHILSCGFSLHSARVQSEEETVLETISWQDFEKVDLRVGTIRSAEVFEKARNPAYILHIDFGPDIGILKSSAQITQRYLPSELTGRQVIAVVNFPPKQIGPLQSQCLVTGLTQDDGSVVLIGPDRPVTNGLKLA
jgi:tRNA-binding protein